MIGPGMQATSTREQGEFFALCDLSRRFETISELEAQHQTVYGRLPKAGLRGIVARMALNRQR